MLKQFAALGFLCVALQPWAAAQETTGTISGRIADTTGAVLVDAVLKAANKDTGVAVSTRSNQQGNYRFEFLPPGTYELSVAMPGFKVATQTLELRTGTQVQSDFTLEVGSANESVTVTAEAALLDTTNAGHGQVINNRSITSIPLALGNPTMLVKLAPGANPGGANMLKYDEPAYTEVSAYSFYGSPAGMTGFTLNGVDNSLSEFGSSLAGNNQPPVEAVQEFKVSHSYDATQGHNSGTSIDVSLKGGTNSYHGTVYGYVRNSALDAKDFFDNRAGNPKPKSEYRRVGFSINGPLSIPKLYDAKNRTFFAYTYENSHEAIAELAGTLTVPTAEQLRGDFSKLLALGPQYQIYDPLTTTPTGNGFYQRQPFPNNIIPPERINAIAKTLSQYWPQPNLPGARDGSANFQPSTSAPTDWYQSYTRVDHIFSQSHRLTFHHALLDQFGRWQDNYNTLATGFRQTITKQNLGLDYVWVVRPNLLFDFRYGYVRSLDPRYDKSSVRDAEGGFDITSLGLDPGLVRQLDLTNSALPHIFLSDFNGIHDNTRNTLDIADVHSAQAQGTYSRGNHNVKMGFEYRASRYNRADHRFVMPRYQFNSDYTKGPLNTSAAAPIGQGLAAFLLGIPSGGYVLRVDDFAASNPYSGAFIQDDWRVTSNLTVNLGLRYDWYGSLTERYNRSVRGFDYNAASPIDAQARAAYARNPTPEIPVDQFQVRGGLLFAGTGNQPRDLLDPAKNLFAPRVGFAYNLRQKTVLRGGYGMYFLPVGLEVGASPIQAGFTRTTDLVPTLDNGVTFIADIRNPFPNGILSPPHTSAGLGTDMGQAIRFFNTNDLKAPYLQRWSFSVQRLLPLDTLLEVGYVGTRSTKLVLSRDLNYVPRQYLSTLPFRDAAAVNFFTQAVPNPFAGLLPGTALNTTNTTREQLLKPFPQFQSVTLGQVNQGYSWYHGLEVKAEKRFAKGFSYLLAYTFSKTMEATSYLNPSDPTPYESIGQFDRTHIFSLTGIWELPFGKGKPFGANAPGALSKIIGGWETAFVWSAMSGTPLTFPDLFTQGAFGDLSLPSGQRSVDRWFNTEAGFVRDSRQQPAYHVRTFPLRFGNVRTAGLNTWDISAIKRTDITERVTTQFYAQFLNAFNHANFGSVVTNPVSGSFGRVTTALTWPRRIQFGLKLLF